MKIVLSFKMTAFDKKAINYFAQATIGTVC